MDSTTTIQRFDGSVPSEDCQRSGAAAAARPQSLAANAVGDGNADLPGYQAERDYRRAVDQRIGSALYIRCDDPQPYARLVARTHFQVHYTLARNQYDDSNKRNSSRETSLNPFDPAIEDAASKQDVRHNLNVNGLFDLGAGFTVSGIIVARSGLPFNQVIGTDTQNDLNDDNDCAIINKHVAARNAVRQPRFFNLDMRLLKSFRLRRCTGSTFQSRRST